jgi:hypothetical protein
MIEIDRAFLVLLAVVMYAHGFPKLLIGGIIVSLLVLEYIYFVENQQVNAYYAINPRHPNRTIP